MKKILSPTKKLPKRSFLKPGAKNMGQQKITDTLKIPSKSVAEAFPSIVKGSKLKICCWNVNGLRATIRKKAFETFINKEDPDILILNETKIDEKKLKEEKLDKLYSEKYASYFNCCLTKGGYSGTALFTKYKPVEVKFGLGKFEHDQEGRLITAEFEDFFLVGTYVPNSGDGLKRLDYRVKAWDVALREHVKALSAKKDVILTGDLNVSHNEIDLFNPKGNKKSAGFTQEERDSFTSLLSEGFTDTFRKQRPEEVKYSYFSLRSNAKKDNRGWRLDYFVVNDKAFERCEDSDILNEYNGSDHDPIRLIWKC